MVGVAEGADALGNHLTLSSEALVLVASGFHVLRNRKRSQEYQGAQTLCT